MIFNLVSVPTGQPNHIVNLNHLGDPFPCSMRSHKILAYMFLEWQRSRWAFLHDGHHLTALPSAIRDCCWDLVLPSVCGPCCSGQLGDHYAGGPSPLRTSVLQPSPPKFLYAEGLLSLFPVPVLHQPQRIFKLSILSGHLYLTSSKHFPPFPPVVGRIRLPHAQVYLLIPRTWEYIIYLTW